MKLIKEEHAGVDTLPQLGVLDRNDAAESATRRLRASILESGRLAHGEGWQVYRQVWLIRGNEWHSV